MDNCPGLLDSCEFSRPDNPKFCQVASQPSEGGKTDFAMSIPARVIFISDFSSPAEWLANTHHSGASTPIRSGEEEFISLVTLGGVT